MVRSLNSLRALSANSYDVELARTTSKTPSQRAPNRLASDTASVGAVSTMIQSKTGASRSSNLPIRSVASNSEGFETGFPAEIKQKSSFMPYWITATSVASPRRYSDNPGDKGAPKGSWSREQRK